MKKQIRIFAVATIVVVTAAAVLVACKKEKDETNVENTLKAQAICSTEQKVTDFLTDLDSRKQGVKVEDKTMCLEDARWLWETTLNYQHGFSHILTTNVRLDTVSILLPKVDERGLLKYSDVIETYGNIVTAIRDKYKTIELENKTLQFVMMSIGDGATKDNDDEIVVVMNTGSETSYDDNEIDDEPWYGVPFTDGTCLRWGNMSNTISSNTGCYWIQYWINYFDLSHQCFYVPCPTCYTYFLVEPYVVTTIHGNSNDPNTFYEEGLTYNQAVNFQICWEDLNLYYSYFLMSGHEEGGCTNVYGEDSYYATRIMDNSKEVSNNSWTIYYEADIINATRVWRSDPAYPNPVPIDEER